MTYINIKNNNKVETVDEFTTYKEAKTTIKEYRLSDTYNTYYLSQRCTKDWQQ